MKITTPSPRPREVGVTDLRPGMKLRSGGDARDRLLVKLADRDFPWRVIDPDTGLEVMRYRDLGGLVVDINDQEPLYEIHPDEPRPCYLWGTEPYGVPIWVKGHVLREVKTAIILCDSVVVVFLADGRVMFTSKCSLKDHHEYLGPYAPGDKITIEV